MSETREKLVANERAKLTATYLNGLAIALVAVGGFGPAFSVRDVANREELGATAFTLLFCLLASGVLPLVARTLLRGLRSWTRTR